MKGKSPQGPRITRGGSSLAKSAKYNTQTMAPSKTKSKGKK